MKEQSYLIIAYRIWSLRGHIPELAPAIIVSTSLHASVVKVEYK